MSNNPNNIIYLSQPSSVSMADDWFDATSIQLLINYLKFVDVPNPYPNNMNYSPG